MSQVAHVEGHALHSDNVPPSENVIDPHCVHVPELEMNLYPALQVVHFPVVTVQAVQLDEHEVQVVAVPPSEYVIAPHDEHFPFSNL